MEVDNAPSSTPWGRPHEAVRTSVSDHRGNPNPVDGGGPDDHSAFWEDRLDDDWTESGVGYKALGLSFNSWMYKAREEVFLREAGRTGIDRSSRILDVGSGTGLYLRWWERMRPAEVVGSDLTSSAVRNLRQHFPDKQVEQLDIAAGTGPFEPASFDVVSCMDVLFHITDDDKYRSALANISRLLKPGGRFVFTENFVHRTHDRSAHQTNRSLAWITEALDDADLTLEHRVPHLVLMNAQVDAPWVWRKAWGGMLRAATLTEFTGNLAGATLYPVERMLARRLTESPTTELAIATRS